MKHYKILALMALAAPTALLTSCLKDDDEVFDTSSSLRLEEAMKNTKSVLTGAENGWVMDYYVGDNASGGGYTFILKFDDMTVTAMSETSDDEATSYYGMTTDNGPVLTFNTYNAVLHEFATPSSDEYEAQGGDFEFLVMNATADLVTLKAKRTGNSVYLYPLEGDAKEYMLKVHAMQDSLIVSRGAGSIDGVPVNAQIDLTNRQMDFNDPNDPEKLIECAYTYTDTGIRLNKTLEFASKPVSAFSFDGATNLLACTDAGNSDFVMQGSFPANWRPYEAFEGNYRLTFDNDGTPGEITLTLVCNNDGSTYSMTNINRNYDITCTYHRAHGALMVNAQELGSTGGNDVFLGMLNNFGYITWNTEAGVEFVWNCDEEAPVYDVTSNSFADWYSEGFYILPLRNGSPISRDQMNSWYQSNQNWLIDNNNVFETLKQLIKVN